MDRTATLKWIYEEWGKGNYGAGLELFDPGVVYEIAPDIVESGRYEGIEGMQAYMRDFLGTWDEYFIEAREIRATADDRVLVRVFHSGRGKTSGVATEMQYFSIWTFKGDRVVHVFNVQDESTARRAAGLAE